MLHELVGVPTAVWILVTGEPLETTGDRLRHARLAEAGAWQGMVCVETAEISACRCGR